MSTYEIDVEACRGRQRRLIAEMERRGLDLVIVGEKQNIQWLAGPHFMWFHEAVAALSAHGRLTLVAPNDPPEVAAADEVLTYEAQWLSTLRNDQRQASSEVLLEALSGRAPKRVGVESSTFGGLRELGGELIDIEADLYVLRRRKDTDEMAFIKKAIAGTGKMYERAREIIKPGISELEVFSQLQAAAVAEFGEVTTASGNDYQCGTPGGPPRDRKARAGELYILDLGPAFRGYFADNCRTIAVTTSTDEQQEAWTYVLKVLKHVEQTVKPGKSARELFQEAQAILAEAPLGVFYHHLGHGFGLFPHEAPHLNPHWDDTFEAGEVFTAEPGLYAPELKGGMRLENNYLVTKDGVELLTDFPLEL